MTGTLSDADHELMDAFLGNVYDEVRSASLGRPDFIETIAYVVTAVDIGEHAEALRLFKDRTPERHIMRFRRVK